MGFSPKQKYVVCFSLRISMSSVSEQNILFVQSQVEIICVFQSSLAVIQLQQQQLLQQFSLLHRNITQVKINTTILYICM